MPVPPIKSHPHALSNQDTHLNSLYAKDIDIKGLEQELRENIMGEVRFDAGAKALYATDASNYRQIPIGVVLPKTEADIIQTIALCKQYKAPVLSRGGGTSLAGQTCNVAVVMDMSKYYNRIVHMDKQNRRVTVQPGIVLDELRKATEREMKLTFGPDPATHDHCTLGGMLGNNSCGVHSVMSLFDGDGARTSDNTESMVVLTYDGLKMKVGPTSEERYQQIMAKGGAEKEIYRKLKTFRDKYAPLIRRKFPDIPRRVSGYNLTALLPENGFNIAEALVGSEGTLVTILEATLKLIPHPNERTLLVLGYKTLPDCGYVVPLILKHKPIGLEGFDDLLLDFMQRKGLNLKDIPLLPPGKAWLMVEFGGATRDIADQKAKILMEQLAQEKEIPSMSLFDDPVQEHMLWEIRESGLGATAWVPGEPNGGPGWEDSAVNPEKIGDYLKDIRALFDQYDYHPSLYGHFGQGCVHCRVGFDFETEQGIQKYKSFTIDAARLVVKYGGSISGEHGDGQARGDLLEIMYGKELVQAFKEFKSIWDPGWKMNPGKIVDTYGQLNDLRLGTHYNPADPKTYFRFPDDNYSFSRVANKCVGVGQCRRHEGGTMCPSYMVTREEKDSTRGRSRMLFEMLNGEVLHGGWQNKQVKESLDLCLACKGCKKDCPVNVDMATYKSEFLFHYYRRKLRSVKAYFFGWIHWWSRLASLMPGMVNFLTHAPLSRNLFKAVAGIAPQRTLPRFAKRTFKSWFRSREKENTTGKPKVILWADTFNNFFLPETLIAGVEVLEAVGFEVMIPKKPLCCGRPLYDFGMLGQARKMLRKIIKTLTPEIQEGLSIIGLEPSCVAVFRDELPNLFPHDKNALRLSTSVFTLAEFLEINAPDFKWPKMDHKALIHMHCHQKSIMKTEYDKTLLNKTGLNYELLGSGCCGMAGYFGYEKGKHYQVSLAAGEMMLLPAVRRAANSTLIISDGFSCREQISQCSNRKALHLAQVLHMGLQGKDT